MQDAYTEVHQSTIEYKDVPESPESFLGQMCKSGRMRIPDLTIAFLKNDKPNLTG